MADTLQRMSDIINEQNNPVAKAQGVVIKGFDGESYPVVKTNTDGELIVAADINMDAEGISTEDTLQKLLGFTLPEFDSYYLTQATDSSWLITYKKAGNEVGTVIITFPVPTPIQVASVERTS